MQKNSKIIPLNGKKLPPEPLKTEYAQKKEAREEQIYREYYLLMARPGAMKTKIYQMLMEQYDIHSRVTVWAIINRVKERKNKEKQLCK